MDVYPTIMELRVGVMNYAWGKIGSNSEVARLIKNDGTVSIDENKPYAELWMGTHPNCPSYIKSSGTALSTVLVNYPKYLGDKSIMTFGLKLPFLFKVLSVRKALSIQVHPDIDRAKKLHKTHPELYKDPNHKPELAIALTNFQAMIGFRPFEEIQNNLKEIFEIQDVIGKDAYLTFLGLVDQQTANIIIPQCFRNLMISSELEIRKALTAFAHRLKSTQNLSAVQANLCTLIIKLYQQFPDDVGCFGPIFLNVINLSPGQAIFLGANEIHAYIEGDCIECMASSDNVIRAGLTPKFKDVETLCSILNYNGAPQKSKLFQPIKENEFTKLFRPPVNDFAVAVTEIPKGKTVTLVIRTVASIALFVKGYGHTHDSIVCSPGTVLFIPANEEVRIMDVTEDITCYIGLANI
ncbi:mannose-6-phosphate isomerase isoform X2 [Atheta coriaria]|uniref:mannose-6-phosphate isomerase isoform X2 n=1 Tax=Dalotia coriaria TaxID=877792 RepID=UPI0031F3BE11